MFERSQIQRVRVTELLLLMKMKVWVLLFVLSSVLFVSADLLHESTRIIGCSDHDGEDMYTLDDEEAWYADFINHRGVDSLPDFVSHPSFDGLYDLAVSQQELCKYNLEKMRQGMKDIPTELDAPSSLIIYTTLNVELGVQNTLICHATGFYPAPVNVTWTKNEHQVTEGTTITVPFPNKDGSFRQTSRLDFIPQQGDIYSCTVEHVALTQPMTRIYDVESAEPSVGPSVFCGLGLAIGLLGVAAGTFFLIKGNECS
ncbi:H-2 class II histocompatibility antigen, A-U alpha chain-like [Oreochromis aureus]|nr:H-2 class II histocompatibility antigen, A-U alpha chain-like [Oreochromis aureus]